MVNFLLGFQSGYTKYPSFLCMWDSRARQIHWQTNKWPLRDELSVGKANVISKPLVSREKIITYKARFMFTTCIVTWSFSDEQGGQFHQDMKVMEERYQGVWDCHMMADYCWILSRGLTEYTYKINSKVEAAFSQTSKPSSSRTISDNDLITLSVPELNERIRSMKLSEKETTALKKRRRTLKNRGYANTCRNKRSQTERSYMNRIEELERQLAEVEAKDAYIQSKSRDVRFNTAKMLTIINECGKKIPPDVCEELYEIFDKPQSPLNFPDILPEQNEEQ
ncbi:hypothetical protein LAZ67_9001754 [Cordylochernes scorpioides]|uniref:Basic leucine zipper domain-containing protein n=1 Tax=Cordylochernes scorpioides TaxID=51811 RepID=A0ABY6KTR6_9ARAC|nr:hypothetical protein LAZ67_9001754 [Cordylochernes scorpioides]